MNRDSDRLSRWNKRRLCTAFLLLSGVNNIKYIRPDIYCSSPPAELLLTTLMILRGDPVQGARDFSGQKDSSGFSEIPNKTKGLLSKDARMKFVQQRTQFGSRQDHLTIYSLESLLGSLNFMVKKTTKNYIFCPLGKKGIHLQLSSLVLGFSEFL